MNEFISLKLLIYYSTLFTGEMHVLLNLRGSYSTVIKVYSFLDLTAGVCNDYLRMDDGLVECLNMKYYVADKQFESIYSSSTFRPNILLIGEYE